MSKRPYWLYGLATIGFALFGAMSIVAIVLLAVVGAFTLLGVPVVCAP